MSRFALGDVASATGAVLLRGDPRIVAGGVSTDTRSLRRGELFVALSGPNFDGNRFATAAVERGAAGLLLGNEGGAPPPVVSGLPRDIPILLHASPRRALGDLARWHRGRLSASVIGVTGSCGKTTTKNVLVELLASRLETVGSPGSFNNDVGVPHTLLGAGADTEAVVVEIGTNAPGEIAALCDLARPTAGVVTCIGAAHLEGLRSLEGVAAEKAALPGSLPAEGFCVLNADCPRTLEMRSRTRARVVTFSVGGKGDLDATEVWFHGAGTTFRLAGLEVTSPLLGLHNVQNLLAALAACRGLGIALEEVLPAVSRLRAARGRLERIRAGRLTILDDSYNANPDSARASVRVLSGLHGHARRVLVLGDMLELGDLAAEMHHGIGFEAARQGIDLLVAVGEISRATAAGGLEGGMPVDHVVHCADTEDALRTVPGLVHDRDVVLVKGSRRMGLDRVVGRLVEFAREDAS